MVPREIDQIVCSSDHQRAVLAKLAKVAETDAEVLITGPSGVGKELYAAYTHNRSLRRSRPFVTVNCSNLSSHLLENEIFGHARGAYTGAHAAMTGIAASAEGGSLFLDEVDSLPSASQAKLLRFIQTKQYRRLGEAHLRSADVRLIAASNVDLEREVREGRFRKDLFFRLRVVPVEIPPLCERPDDIAPLLEHFAARYAEEYRLPPVVFGDSALICLKAYSWPGNVRELENSVRYLTCLQLGRPVECSDLALCSGIAPASTPAITPPDDGEPTEDAEALDPITDEPMQQAKQKVVDSFERHYVDRALADARGNVSAAARASGKHRRAFFELMRKHGLNALDYRRRV
jgi:DNA-binding NtrC family response regulator